MATEQPTSAEEIPSAESIPSAEEISPTAAPALPNFYTDPDSVLKDLSVSWRYGKPPDYSKTRRLFAESKSPLCFCFLE